MSKHTQGKWEIEQLEVFGRGDEEGTADIVVHDEDGEGSTVIAKGIGYEDEEEHANALLMASAPDLLAALEALFQDYKELADSGDAGFWKLENQDVGKQALAAIAKAKGE